MKNFSGVCQAAGADKPLRAFIIWITNIVTLINRTIFCRYFIVFQELCCLMGVDSIDNG